MIISAKGMPNYSRGFDGVSQGLPRRAASSEEELLAILMPALDRGHAKWSKNAQAAAAY